MSKIVFEIFEEISQIPRGSGNEQAISDYLMNFAKKRGLNAKQDSALNVVIYKEGSAGYENHAPLILQSHMDMVCEKNSDTVHDFLKDPISLRTEGDFLYANGTTLGADNGVGMAISLAALDANDIAHPPLEVIFTSEEETTMKGISALDASWLKARRMINMDSGSDTAFCVGCAGGVRFELSVPVKKEALPQDMICKHLTVRGLKGGHSGVEIHLGLANSIRILGRALDCIKDNMCIVSLSGGLKTNAIPREADAIIALPASEVGKAEQLLSNLQSTLREEYRTQDPDISLALTEAEPQKECLSQTCAKKAVAAMLLLPYGVLHMSYDIPDLVETSNNIGVMTTSDKQILFECALRSSVPSRRDLIKTQVEALAESMLVKAEFAHGYPSWTYNPSSPLLAIAVKQFKEMYNKEPEIAAVHAGLECGFMMEKIPEMDIISYCAKMYDAHTPHEHLSISSTERVWEYTKALLKAL